MSNKLSSIHRAQPSRKLILALIPFVLCCLGSESRAVDVGSSVPLFSLPNLPGWEVSLEPPSRGSFLILYFFDASDKAVETLARLNEAASNSLGAVSLLGVSRANPKSLESLIEDGALHSVVFCDNKGITLAYGLARKLPAAVVVGPGGIAASVLAPVGDAGEILMLSADAFISMGLPASAMKIYQSMPPRASGPRKALAVGYASVLMGDIDGARRTVEPLARRFPSLSSDAHAASGFLLFHEGKDAGALAECRQAPTNGFANWIAAMVNARAGKCDAASMLFDKAAKGEFAFRWQKALALNMAARRAETKGDSGAVPRLYKKAFALAPLSPTVNANLLMHHWRGGKFPAAASYAHVIKSTRAENLLIRALVAEFESDREFVKDGAARTQLAQRLKKPRTQETGGKTVRAGVSHTILVHDLAFTDCITELNCLPLAGAGLLRKSLEDIGALTAIRRPEMVEAAKHLSIADPELQDPVRVAKVARALSADLMAFGEVGTYRGKYVLNLRIAELGSGEVIAVTSERLASFEELGPAIQRSAAVLIQKIAAYYSSG